MRSRARWLFAAAGLGLAALGLGAAGGPVDAQQGGASGAELARQFGGFELNGRANGLQITYDLVNVLPIPPPLLQVSVPEASASMASGPATSALGSVAYPGSLVANLPALVAQAAPGAEGFIPPYPVLTRAAYPAGPPESSQEIATANSTARTSDTGAVATATLGGADLPDYLKIGAITTVAHAGFGADGTVESRARVELAGIDLLFGLIHIDALVTDLVATSDGTAAASDGGTTLSGLRVLGRPATIGPDGIQFLDPVDVPQSPLTPLLEGLDLGPLAEQLDAVLAPVNDLLTPLLDQVSGSLTDLLAAAGITIRVLEPVATGEGPAASRTANGLYIELRYDGATTPVLSDLLASLAEVLPSEGLPGIPLPTSPQALVNLLRETHVVGLAIGYASVDVRASAAFEPAAPTTDGGTGGGNGGGGGTFTPGRPSTPPPAFSTPPPQLGSDTPEVASEPVGSADLFGPSLPVGLVLAAVAASPLFAAGSRRLADNALAAGGRACPEGLDRRDA